MNAKQPPKTECVAEAKGAYNGKKLCFGDAFVYGYVIASVAFAACKRPRSRIALSFIQ